MFNPRDATQTSILTKLAHRLGLRRESHVIYLIFGLMLFIGYMWYSTTNIFGPPRVHTLLPHIIKPTHQELAGVTTVFESVPSPRGLVMLFHGCSHQASDWFTLPEERRIVQKLLQSRFSVIAFSSHDRQSGCWSNTYPDLIENMDIRAVSKALRSYLEQEKRTLENTPLFAVGASSGGSFVTVAARHMPLHGGVIIVSPGLPEALTASTTNQARAIPPLTFVYMTRDNWANKDAINTIINEMLNVNNVVRPIVYEATPHALTPTYMNERIPNITIQESQRFYELAKTTWCDEKGMMKNDPRETTMLHEMIAIMDVEGGHSLRSFHDALVEELNVLWGGHEMTSEHMEQWIPWMESLADKANTKQ